MKGLIFRKTGEPKSVLELAEIPTPPLGTGEALVRVLLSPINASDLHMVRGRYGYQPELPASPGIEAVGIVEALGPGAEVRRLELASYSLTRGARGANKSCAQWTNSCPFLTAWMIRPPPLRTSIL
jgi:NADPH:quinone reductase-like Zn-dependent oxidoreductase